MALPPQSPEPDGTLNRFVLWPERDEGGILMHQDLAKPVCKAIRLTVDPQEGDLTRAQEVRVEVAPCGKHQLPSRIEQVTDQELLSIVQQLVWDKLADLFDLQKVRHVKTLRIHVVAATEAVAAIYRKIAAMVAEVFRVAGTCGIVEMTA